MLNFHRQDISQRRGIKIYQLKENKLFEIKKNSTTLRVINETGIFKIRGGAGRRDGHKVQCLIISKNIYL